MVTCRLKSFQLQQERTSKYSVGKNKQKKNIKIVKSSLRVQLSDFSQGKPLQIIYLEFFVTNVMQDLFEWIRFPPKSAPESTDVLAI